MITLLSNVLYMSLVLWTTVIRLCLSVLSEIIKYPYWHDRFFYAIVLFYLYYNNFKSLPRFIYSPFLSFFLLLTSEISSQQQIWYEWRITTPLFLSNFKMNLYVCIFMFYYIVYSTWIFYNKHFIFSLPCKYKHKFGFFFLIIYEKNCTYSLWCFFCSELYL